MGTGRAVDVPHRRRSPLLRPGALRDRRDDPPGLTVARRGPTTPERSPMKRALVLIFALLALHSQSPGGDPPLPGNVLRDGEVLQYKVKWSFIRLGTVTLRTVRDTSC